MTAVGKRNGHFHFSDLLDPTVITTALAVWNVGIAFVVGSAVSIRLVACPPKQAVT
jgi:hypothetical protein